MWVSCSHTIRINHWDSRRNTQPDDSRSYRWCTHHAVTSCWFASSSSSSSSSGRNITGNVWFHTHTHTHYITPPPLVSLLDIASGLPVSWNIPQFNTIIQGFESPEHSVISPIIDCNFNLQKITMHSKKWPWSTAHYTSQLSLEEEERVLLQLSIFCNKISKKKTNSESLVPRNPV